MTGVTNADSGAEVFAYSGNGQRRSKSSSGGDVLYVWDAENVLEELEGNGALIARYTDYPGYWGGLTSLFLAGGNPPIPPAGMGMFNVTQFNGPWEGLLLSPPPSVSVAGMSSFNA